jgi:hypothetical protein
VRFPSVKLILYGAQLNELTSQLRGVHYDADDLVTLAYYSDGSVSALVDGTELVTVRRDV